MRRGSAQMKLSLDQKIAVSLLVFLIICLLVFWVLLEKPVQTPDGADEARNLQPAFPLALPSWASFGCIGT
jgi:hypothetical protein